MNATDDLFVVSGVRTAIGKYGGGLASVPPCDLAAAVVREAASTGCRGCGGGSGCAMA
jgi:acetyl-CoA C-acetyltransferase